MISYMVYDTQSIKDLSSHMLLEIQIDEHRSLVVKGLSLCFLFVNYARNQVGLFYPQTKNYNTAMLGTHI